MTFLAPRSLSEALELRAAHPAAVPLAGGTDVMVGVNAGTRRPALLDLTRVPELREWTVRDGIVRLGAGVTYSRVVRELSRLLPGLSAAGATVGSAQIRNRATVGGNVATASPAGDGVPPLIAAGAEVELSSVREVRRIPLARFATGPKRTVLAADELVTAVLVPVRTGPQAFAKIGGRNAMVIAVANVAVDLRPDRREVGAAIGAAAATVRHAPAAAHLAATELNWAARHPADTALLREFGALIAAAAAPIDDVRGTAAYRRHALAVIAARALGWAWDEYRATTRNEEPFCTSP
ncbi:FAD binding domain-containing protein [Nocardia alni]|uniref:FAD binding domain-containing protein n=1 Tax=Nocardia alni TaxID=2815723 RepID=UPI001C2185BA|nr:FAD binding domain-containing protein [Nocardia alni]